MFGGRVPKIKGVPSEIFFSSPDIIKSFLDGPDISGDGTVAKEPVFLQALGSLRN